MIGHRKKSVRIRGQVDADDVGLLIHDEIDETGILMAETVVILPPNVRCQKIIQRRNRTAPGYVARRLQPFGVPTEHPASLPKRHNSGSQASPDLSAAGLRSRVDSIPCAVHLLAPVPQVRE